MAEQKDHLDAAALANTILAVAEGKIHQFVRSGFKRSPLENWDQQWQFLAVNL
jgi:TetR/AcrR family transcriptional regulator